MFQTALRLSSFAASTANTADANTHVLIRLMLNSAAVTVEINQVHVIEQLLGGKLLQVVSSFRVNV